VQHVTHEITNQQAFLGAIGHGEGGDEEIDDLLFATSDAC